MNAHDVIKEKLRKLLNMTVQNGCTEDEAETALRMAAGLMARHGIDQSELEAADVKNLARIGKRVSLGFKPHQLILAMAAGALYGCRVLFYASGKAGLEFVGRQDNIEAAEQTMFWLMEQVERFYKEALPKGLDKRTRAEYRRTFKDACAHRVEVRVRDLMANMTQNDTAAQEATGRNALVVAGYFEKLLEEAKMAIDGLGNVKSKTIHLRAGVGTAAGTSAGDRVQLRKEVR